MVPPGDMIGRELGKRELRLVRLARALTQNLVKNPSS